MNKTFGNTLALVASAVLVACGGGGDDTSAGPTTLTAGSTLTLAANASVSVPSGTTVTTPGGSVITINGSGNTINASAGSVVTVPATATGPANDVVVAGGVAAGSAASTAVVTALAGSPNTNSSPVDGTGTAAVLAGGGSIVVDPGGDLIVSDGGKLRRVTQAGVVTTLPSQSPYWGGIGIDATGNIFGSTVQTGANGPFLASITEFSTSNATTTLFANWETGASPALGIGGVVVDASGNVYLADVGSNTIVKFVPGGAFSVLAGNGSSGNVDGTGAAASFMLDSSGLTIDNVGNLYVSSGTTIRKISPAGVVTTAFQNLSGTSLAIDRSGNLFTAGAVGWIHRVSTNGTTTDFPFSANGFATSLACDSAGNLYVGTQGSGAQIYKITF